jgi:hypothetical protein
MQVQGEEAKSPLAKKVFSVEVAPSLKKEAQIWGLWTCFWSDFVGCGDTAREKETTQIRIAHDGDVKQP